jgi:Flp pilus assembly protein TadD
MMARLLLREPLRINRKKTKPWLCWLWSIVFVMVANCASAESTNAPTISSSSSSVIEAAGEVEFQSASSTNWQHAPVGTTLRPGDRLRTRDESRAAVQLSDRSILRLNEQTTLEIFAPRHAEKKRFGLKGGSIFFFNREKPADVEFDTPLAAGAIRGTEFLLEVTGTNFALRLALIDGLVTLQTSDGEVSLERGQDLRLAPGQPAQKTALVNATAAIQWALYYPAVLDPDELHLSPNERNVLGDALSRYRAGNLLGALAVWPTNASLTSAGGQTLHAALQLSVGNVVAAETILAQLSPGEPPIAALRELIAAVRGDIAPSNNPASASEFLARSYSLQAAARLPEARAAASQAVKRAPQFGFAHARLAELEFSFGNRHAALDELEVALKLSPRLTPAHGLRGFVLLEQNDATSALAEFNEALRLDAAFGPAWLGRGLCLLHERDFTEARASFQAAAALEPQRALFRAYLGKAASELGAPKAAEKEFNLAKRLDAKDPTGWLYSALHLWRENRLNEAIRDLERSADLNDQRAPFRSRLLLDEDRSVRSANLAALYDEAGLVDASRHAATRAVAEDYGNFSGHLFLADTYQALLAANRFDLRLQTARESELLVANLLAPPGAGNLSQQFSQQEHLQFFEPRPIGFSSRTTYGSGGDWSEAATLFGTVDGFSYALDQSYESLNGQRVNNDSTARQYSVTMKQRVTPDDDFYFQLGYFKSDAGDLANYYDPAQAKTELRVNERQLPTLFAGWHHEWSPGSHTLFLFGRLDDRLQFHDPQGNAYFLHLVGGVPQDFLFPAFTNDLASTFTLYSAELQQIWETPRHTLIVGGRGQYGDVNNHAILSRDLTGIVTAQHADNSFTRGNAYVHDSWRLSPSITLVGGVSYDRLEFPENSDQPPISGRERSRDLIAPRAGLLWAPWDRGLFRANYAQSLGGLFFDNSVRLEPTQIGGFNQAFRSLIPESVSGLVPGTKFETAGIGFDQSLRSGTWFGVEAEWLTSDGARTVGVLTNSLFFPVPDSPSGTRQSLNFRERDLSAYAAQLVGDWFSFSTRYRLSEAHLAQNFPQIPAGVNGLDFLEPDRRATLQQLSLAANFNHPSGIFAQWESQWSHQNNSSDTPQLADSDFWQHNIFAGYRFPRRMAEVQVGILNLFDRDYRLNPLNLHSELPRGRTFVASLRINF